MANFALITCVADADDGRRTAVPRRFLFRGDHRVGFVMPPAALGMAEDHAFRVWVAQQFGVNITGQRPRLPALQSSPPIAIWPSAACTARAITVAGTQTSTSKLVGLARAAHAIASILSSCARNPCIFLLPAIRIRTRP